MNADHVFDSGDMDCGSGLILLIRQNLQQVPAGGIMELRSVEPSVGAELPPWCRMAGHEFLGTEDDGPGRWRHYVRRTADDAAALAADRRKAQDFVWRVRARCSGLREAAVYARNHSWKLGPPVSFEEKDAHPSALEAALGALAAELLNGFATACRQHGCAIDDMESTLSARLHDNLAFTTEEGDASLAGVDLTVFITSPAAGDVMRRLWSATLRRSPLYLTWRKACTLETRLVIL